MGKELILIKNSFFNKIKNFFINFFKRKKDNESVKITNETIENIKEMEEKIEPNKTTIYDENSYYNMEIESEKEILKTIYDFDSLFEVIQNDEQINYKNDLNYYEREKNIFINMYKNIENDQIKFEQLDFLDVLKYCYMKTKE